MKIKNWTDKITDESDLWLNAIKMEDANDFAEASVFYLNDAVQSLKQNLYVRGALSCLGAAECLIRMGHHTDACRLYLETATIYEENADRIIGNSVRESLWCLQESYENFLLASNYSGAQKIFDKYVFLARKLNPFFGEDETLELLRSKKEAVEKIQKSWNCFDNAQNSGKLCKAIEDLISLRQTSQPSTSLEQIHSLVRQKESLT